MKALISLSALAILSLAGEIFGFKRQTNVLLIIGLLVTLVLNFMDWNTNISYFSNMMQYDNFSVAFTGAMLLCGLAVVLLSPNFFKVVETSESESYAQLLFLMAGGLLMVSFSNLSMFFIGVELLSIASYILAGTDKRNLYSNEAALKYFLMGAFWSSFLLMGIALVYAAAGSFDLATIAAYSTKGNLSGYFYLGTFFTILALAFKVSAAPFHFWAPDVYDGSPTIVTLSMSTIVKIAAFGAAARLFSYALYPAMPSMSKIWWILTALTLLVGSLGALQQTSFKRLLAYSGVANAGYLLLGLIAANNNANNALLFYLIAYSVATISAFAVLLLLSYKYDDENGEHFKGLATTSPWLAAAVTVSMLSLAGIPPTAGFFGKYYLFTQAIAAGHTSLVVVAILSSIVSIVYYFRIIINMYIPDENSLPTTLELPFVYKIVLIITTITSLALGIYPSVLANIL